MEVHPAGGTVFAYVTVISCISLLEFTELTIYIYIYI